MTPQELKNSILQLAIQGKLVEQRPEEGTAAELYKQIQAEKQALIKAGKIKKEKPLPEITEEEIPFEIPESWKWVRLDDLVTKEIKRGKSPTYVPKSGTLVFAQKCNTKAGYIDLSLSLFLDETKLSKYPESEFICKALIAFINDGSHSIFDDLVVSFDESSLENYLRVFKLIFERLHHIDHYNMMMRVNSGT